MYLQQYQNQQKSMRKQQKRKGQNYDKLISEKYQQAQKCLNLQGCRRQWLNVLKSRDWSNLKMLYLNGCQIKDNQIKTFSQMQWPNLQTLRIQTNQIKVKGLQCLLSNRWPKLSELRLGENQLEDEGLRLLLSKKNDLKCLTFHDNNCTNLGFSLNVASVIHNPNLIQLDISFNPIGSKGIKLLTKFSLPSLQHLRVVGCDINDEGCKHLSKARWPNLKNLSIQQNDITFNGNLSLINYNIKDLQFINVGNLDEIGNSENDIDMISLMIFVCALNTNTMVCPSNLNMDFLEQEERIIRNKFLRNMYEM